MTDKQSIISAKARDVTQITINGVQMSEVASFVELNLESLRKELTVNSQYVNLLLEKKIDDLSRKLKRELSVSDLGTFRFYVKLVETYSERPEKELANILCDILAESLPSEKGSILRSSLHEAIDIARLLNQSQMKLLAFIFLLRNCIFKNINSFGSFEIFVKEILWRFYPDGLSSQVLPKHLEYSKCTTFVAREMLISRMLTNSYLPAIENEKLCAVNVMEIMASGSECHNTNALPEASRLSRQVFDLHNLSREFAPNVEVSSHYNPKKGNDEHKEIEKKVISLIVSCPNGEKTYVEWASSPIKNHVLTPVGMVIAISTIRNELGYDLDYSKWIY
ncbi:MAG: hypothetical protein KAH05_02205 [Clostridiales bacterium]|nr:hypothetical protein [Clostridiales bacterium]